MKVGDPIAVSRFVPEPLNIIPQLDRDVELIGALIGDGCVSGGHHGDLVSGTEAVLARQRYRELFEMYPDTEVDEYLDISGGSQRWRSIPKNIGSRSHSYAVREMAERFGLSGHKALTKHIPEVLFSLDNRQTALLVSRLIDTDGWVCKSNTWEIGYGSISKQLAEDVQKLFLRLGALAECKEKWTTYEGEPYLSYQVRVRDRAGLLALASALTLLDKDEKRLALIEELTSRAFKQQLDHGDLVWDKIKSIEYIGDDEYWTLTVDGPASYIGQFGILHHNSGKITSAGFLYLESLMSYFV